MEQAEKVLLRDKERYEGQRQKSKRAEIDLAERWDAPDFSMEQKQAAIARTLSTVIIKPVGKGSKGIRSTRMIGSDFPLTDGIDCKDLRRA